MSYLGQWKQRCFRVLSSLETQGRLVVVPKQPSNWFNTDI